VSAASAAAVALGARALETKAGTVELCDLSAVEAVAAIRRGEISAERFASALLARCAAAASLNAFVTLEPERVLDSARAADKRRASGARLGALHGLPIPIKDSVNTRDFPTSGGTAALRNFRPAVDAPLVARLREAGAIVLGKTNLHEISFGFTSASATTGVVHNPYDPSRIPGGSSGGSAAAVSARMAPLGVAEDTAGSIRVPAAMCGIVGFRPTTGRYPSQGVLPMTALFDQLGPHARNVDDVILFDATVTGDHMPLPPSPLHGVKLAVARAYYFANLDPEVDRIIGEAIRRLQDAGAAIVDVEIPGLAELVNKAALPIILHDLAPSIATYLKSLNARVSVDEVFRKLGPEVAAKLAAMTSIKPSDAEYRALVTVVRPALQERLATAFKATGASAIVFPTTPVPAVALTQGPMIAVGGADVPFEPYCGRNVIPGSTAGLPGLVLPAGLTRGGLPVGIEFDGPAGSDRFLLALGRSLERALGPIPAPRLIGSGAEKGAFKKFEAQIESAEGKLNDASE
jgi:mandelamide amidase